MRKENWDIRRYLYSEIAGQENYHAKIVDTVKENYNPFLFISLNNNEERCQQVTDFLNNGKMPTWIKDIIRYENDHTFHIEDENKSIITAGGPFMSPFQCEIPEDAHKRKELIDRFFKNDPNKNKIIIEGCKISESIIICIECGERFKHSEKYQESFDVYIKCPHCKAETRL